MILENTAQFDDEIVGELELSENFVGDAGEFGELTNDALSEMHNLTVALARLEHKSLVESNQELLDEGVKEFFAAAAAKIKAWWDTFIQWLGSMWTKLKDALVKRADWLGRNKGVISGVDAAKLAGVKVKIGKNLLGSDFGGAARASIAEAQKLVAAAGSVTPQDGKSFKERAMEALKKPLKVRNDKASLAKNIHDSLIGEAEEVELTKAIVGQLLAVAENTFKAVDQMKGAKIVADAAVKTAEGMARVEGGDQAAVNAKISALRDVGTMVQATIAGYSSAIGAANSMAMPILVKVAGLADKKDDKPAAEPQNASTSLLAAFM
jgi:hypothetical protein